MQPVFVVDADNKPLAPTHPAKARRLLSQGKATVKQVYPFTVQLDHTIDGPVMPHIRIGIDPGVVYGGIAFTYSYGNTNLVALQGTIRLGSRISTVMENKRVVVDLVTKHMNERANYRRGRRSGRRKSSDGRKRRWICSSIDCRREHSVSYPSTTELKNCPVCGAKLMKRPCKRTKVSGRKSKYRPMLTHGVPWKLRNPDLYHSSLGTQYRKWLKDTRGWTEGRDGREGYITPTIRARGDRILRTIDAMAKILPITPDNAEFVVEQAKFDLQKMRYPGISGVEYQRGETFGYHNLKAAMCFEYGRKVKDKETGAIYREAYCCFCGKDNVPLEIEHVIPRSRGGGNGWDNLVLACVPCNKHKGNRTPEEAGMKMLYKPKHWDRTELATSYATQTDQLVRYLKDGLEKRGFGRDNVKWTYGTWTQFWRKKMDLPKEHYNDALTMAVMTFDSNARPTLPTNADVAPFKVYALPRDGAEGARYFAENLPPEIATARHDVDLFGHTAKRQRVVNDCLVLENGKWHAVKVGQDIPNNVKVLRRGYMVRATKSGRRHLGYITGILSNGTFNLTPIDGKQMRGFSPNKCVVLSTSRVLFFPQQETR